jgi:hypothetical protein
VLQRERGARLVNVGAAPWWRHLGFRALLQRGAQLEEHGQARLLRFRQHLGKPAMLLDGVREVAALIACSKP